VKGLLLAALGLFAVLLLWMAPVASSAPGCRATPTDAAGPFAQGEPPLRAKIGRGHVLTGVVLSALDCRPVAGARVQFWQENPNGVYTRASSGSVITGRSGRFRFEGPVPPSDGGFPPHIHIRVDAVSFEALLTRYLPPRGSHHGTIRLVLKPDNTL
jgi:protocatechuate 3,4-dioxygenase beta subunit